MATVSAAGSVWSAVYLDHASSKCDQEGFLIGEVVKETTTNISDSQISKKTEQVSINIYTHYACSEPFSFYDNKGNVDQGRLLAMLKDNYRNVVGWYQMRRNVPQEPTLRDRSLHGQLMKTLRDVSPNTFILALFTTNLSWNQSIHSLLHQFYTITNSGFKTIPLAVFNLGETAQTEYRLSSGNMGSTTPNSTYTQILNTFKPKLLHPGGTVEGVQKVHLLNDTMHQKLKALTSNVSDSEKQVQRLTDEVNDLERRAQRQRRERQRQAANVPAANGKPMTPIVVRPSSQPTVASFLKSSPPAHKISQETAPPVPPHKTASSSRGDIVDSRILSNSIKTIPVDSHVSSDKNRKTGEQLMEEVEMDTTPVKNTKAAVDPSDPFAGLLADMKKSIPVKKTPVKKAYSFKSIGAKSAGDGPRPDRSHTFPQLNDIQGGGDSQSSSSSSSSPSRNPNMRSSSLGGKELGNSDSETSQGITNSRHSPGSMQGYREGEMGEDAENDDDDATQMTGDFEYTQSGSPTF